jgi:hypothetical protein
MAAPAPHRYPAAVRLVRRLASPAGFLLALLFLLLPFVAASCDAPGLGSVKASYTGVDLATGGEPSVRTEGELTAANGVPVPTPDNAPRPAVRGLAIITVAMLLAGLGVSLAPALRIRTYGAIGAAVASGTLLVTTEAAAQANLKPALSDGLQRLLAERPGDVPAVPTGGSLDSLVHSESGFWLSLVTVLVVLLFNAGSLLWPRIGAPRRAKHPQ